MTEVLAPAGSIETLEVAIKAGADAVYFGTEGFNARRNAKNFTVEEMRQATRFARIRGAKTYLTLNTLTADSELSAALLVAEKAAECGVDAFIVQDLGLIRLLKKYLPAMPLHASTQMSVHSEEALEPLANLGFKRVVVAREMNKSSLEKFCLRAKELNIQVEAFVHGALCMSMSGQCYLSSVLGGRSGNRGLCAQPCRLGFSVENGTGHDLSLKDMSYISHIKEMIDIGVQSFKIEGRMKRPEYVAAAVAAVRAATDGKAVDEKNKELLSGIFSRSGHTDGYYTDRLGRDMFGIRTATDEKLSARLCNTAHELYRRERQSVKVTANLEVKKDLPIKLTATDEDKNSVTVVGVIPEMAQKTELDKAFAISKIIKSGGTCYYFKKIETDIEKGLTVRGGDLSNLRNAALESLSAKRAETYKKTRNGSRVAEYRPEKFTRKTTTSKVAASFKNIDQIPKNLEGISAVILPVETDFSKLKLNGDIKIIADIPRGMMQNGQKVLQQLKSAKANGCIAAVCGNLSAFTLTKEANMTPIAGFGMNIYNSESLKVVEELGSKAAIISFEASLNDIVNMGCSIPKGIISYGRLPLMLFRNCPQKNGGGCKDCKSKGVIVDRKGIEFPIQCRGEFSEMLNSRPVWLFDRKSELTGIDFEVLYFTDEEKERCEQVIAAYKVGSSPDVEFTRGLYYREVY